MEKVNIFLSQAEDIDSLIRATIPIDILLRQGNVVSAYRQGVQVIGEMSKKEYESFVKILSRAILKIRKGEQIDALNDIKSLLDLLKNEKKRIFDSLKEYLEKKND